MYLSFHQMKEAASFQMQLMSDVTLTVGRGLRKTIRSYSREAGKFSRSLSDFVDLEDLFKSIDEVAHPEKHAQRKSSIIHTPIGKW